VTLSTLPGEDHLRPLATWQALGVVAAIPATEMVIGLVESGQEVLATIARSSHEGGVDDRSALRKKENHRSTISAVRVAGFRQKKGQIRMRALPLGCAILAVGVLAACSSTIDVPDERLGTTSSALTAKAVGGTLTSPVVGTVPTPLTAGGACANNVQRQSSNGWLITSPKVYAVYWGAYWTGHIDRSLSPTSLIA
jgi:hypothetical protein